MPEHKSGDEIERVFKVRQMPKNIEEYPCENIVQGYLAIDVTGAEVRLRQIGDRYFETFKGSGRLQRREIRYLIDGGGQKIELNVFRGNLAGLVLAEVEFPSREKSEEFKPPAWFGEEVTEDGRYKNQNLARDGAPNDDPRK